MTLNPDYCDKKLKRKFKFKVCYESQSDANDINSSFEFSSQTRIKFNATEVVPFDWETPLDNKECRVAKRKEVFNPCDGDADPMDTFVRVQNKNEDKKCKLSRKSTIVVERSQSQSEQVQVKLQVQGESFPDPTPCMSNNYMFTELAYPNDFSWNGKYVEVFNPDCAGQVISDEIFIVRYPGELHISNPQSFSLGGLQIRDDGFLIICNELIRSTYGGGGSSTNICDLKAHDVGPVMPQDVFEIQRRQSGNVVQVIDAFGYPAVNTEHFPVQRAVRKIGSTPSSEYNPDEWDSSKLALAQEMDPRAWIGD